MKSFQFAQSLKTPLTDSGSYSIQTAYAQIAGDGVSYTGIPLPMVELGDAIVATPKASSVTIEGKAGIFLDLTKWGFQDMLLGLPLPLAVSDCEDPTVVFTELLRRYKDEARYKGKQYAYDWMKAEVTTLVESRDRAAGADPVSS